MKENEEKRKADSRRTADVRAEASGMKLEQALQELDLLRAVVGAYVGQPPRNTPALSGTAVYLED